MNFPEGCNAIEIGEVPPLKGEPSTDLKLPEEVSTRYAATALACGMARNALRPEEPPLLPLPPQLASQPSAKMIPSKPARLCSVIKSLPHPRGYAKAHLRILRGGPVPLLPNRAPVVHQTSRKPQVVLGVLKQ